MADTALTRLRDICLSLPDSKETLTWGSPHFRVGEKIFAGYGEEKGRRTIGFKLEMEHADAVVQDPRFERAPYVGHRGWVSLDANSLRAKKDWEMLRAMILESYRLIAPKRTFARWEAEQGAAVPVTRKAPRKTTSKARSARKRR